MFISLKPVFYVFFFFFLGYILFTFGIIHCVCLVSVEYVRSTMEIRRSRL